MNIGDKIMMFMILTFVVVPAYIIYDAEANTHWECHEEAVISDILSVDYRHATILTVKGREIVLNQPTVKVGDVICLSGKQVRNDDE